MTNSNNVNLNGKAVFKFADNIVLYLGCNVYECSYYKNGYTFYLQNQGLCNQKTQNFCEDNTIDQKYLDLMKKASQVR